MVQDPITLYVALDRSGYAKGNIYLDDGATHEYKKGIYVSTEVEYKTESSTEAIIYGQPTSDSGKYETETWLERVVVRGLERTPKNVSVSSWFMYF
ncbi:hypothetical protein OESDEN_15103 [Oesophagostomum dentatum]|uniref:DUF5110 domain-containing protein n=1 Tax=Oesophagostomum dentatum TaxID=61180 RepID=A0A0B1SPU0_OESDE|nr:hypothetical protein OESDEN_15103 [Oesophagostomum dentatum]